MILACEGIFSRTSLDGRPLNLHTFSKVNLKYAKCTFPVGQARCSFHLPHGYNLHILLARGNGASTNVEPCTTYFLKRPLSLLVFLICNLWKIQYSNQIILSHARSVIVRCGQYLNVLFKCFSPGYQRQYIFESLSV